MAQFTTLTSRQVALPINDIDTDQIIPAQFLKVTDKNGLGQVVFHSWRFLEDGSPNPEFVLNKPESQGAQILLAGDNFGCGSSREHAPWAIKDAGFEVVVSSYFADIFYNNSLKNGLLLAAVSPPALSELLDMIEETPSTSIRVDLLAQTVSLGAHVYPFEIDPYRKLCLAEGLDDLSYLLRHEPQIAAYEKTFS